MLDWFWKRIFTPNRVGYLLTIAQPYLTEYSTEIVKETIHNTLEDEEIGQHIQDYGDALFNHYSKMFWGQVGGLQKGINSEVNREIDKMNPLAFLEDAFDDEGNFSLAQAIKVGGRMYIQNRVNSQYNPGFKPQIEGNTNRVPEMKRI